MLKELRYVEYKSDDNKGPATISWITYSKSGRSIYYQGTRLEVMTTKGRTPHYFEPDSEDQYWVKECCPDGSDALVPMVVTIDEDAREEYWCNIRNLPENKNLASIQMPGKFKTK